MDNFRQENKKKKTENMCSDMPEHFESFCFFFCCDWRPGNIFFGSRWHPGCSPPAAPAQAERMIQRCCMFLKIRLLGRSAAASLDGPRRAAVRRVARGRADGRH